MVTVREYRFTILITFGSPVPEGPRAATWTEAGTAASSSRSGTRHTCQVISRDTRPLPGAHAVLAIPLAGSEAEEFFPPGQRFTIWADALVGQTVCGDGFAGYGVISPHEPQSQPLSAARDREVVVRPDSSMCQATEARAGRTR